MTSIKTTQWKEAAEAVESAQSILVVTHVSPDGDAIGSMLGLVNGLRSIGKVVDCAVDEGSPSMFNYLPGVEGVYPKLYKGEWDLMISSDASDEERTGLVGEYGRAHSKVVINLDHHATNTMFGDIHLVDSDAVSAAEVVFRWFETMNLELTREIAMPILTGMVTDTLGFRTSNVTADTLGIAQELMRAGASLTEVTARALDNKNFLTINLWKRALAKTELHAGGIISAEISQDDLRSAGLFDNGDQGLVGFLIKVDEAMISVVFKETPEGEVNISLRSKPGFDVSQVAFSLGGGGHKQASGATIKGTMEEVKARVMPLLREAAKAGKLIIA